jgi:hypothetical protein
MTYGDRADCVTRWGLCGPLVNEAKPTTIFTQLLIIFSGEGTLIRMLLEQVFAPKLLKMQFLGIARQV